MDVGQWLEENGYEGVKYLSDFSYDSAFVGMTWDDRCVYDYDKMVQWIVETQGWEELEAVEWIEYNTIRALPYMGEGAPIVMYGVELDE